MKSKLLCYYSHNFERFRINEKFDTSELVVHTFQTRYYLRSFFPSYLMETAIYNPSRFRLIQPTLHSSSRSAIDMQSSSRSSFSLRGWAHAQPLVRVLVPVRTRVKCIVVRGESTDLIRPVSILTVVGEGSSSPLKNTPWEEVMQHTANRLKWVDEGVEMHVFTDKSFEPQGKNHENFRNQLYQCDMLVNVAVQNKDSVDWLLNNCKNVPNIISFESSPFLVHKLGGQIISNGKRNSSEVVKTVVEAWERCNSDDIRFCILVLINSYIRPVSVLKNLRAKGLSTLTCMVKNCGPQILNCLLDSNCRKALQCLNSCSPVDQVCNYRCIASYESPNLEAFSLCVLQKHNCLELDAEIPTKLVVPPLLTFRGQSLSHETAEDLFIGWLGDLEWSWRVIAGQNPAYDQFPCQYQLFYRGKAKGSFWYEPVFQVRTLDGNLVWRRRRYRVKRSVIPGTFYFTVLDNGVVSKEFWTIVDVADDLSWGFFHYSGAARAAGQSYTGSVLVSPDGRYPGTAGAEKRIETALEKCGIKNWELYSVDNCSCEGAPLGLPEDSRLHATIAV